MWWGPNIKSSLLTNIFCTPFLNSKDTFRSILHGHSRLQASALLKLCNILDFFQRTFETLLFELARAISWVAPGSNLMSALNALRTWASHTQPSNCITAIIIQHPCNYWYDVCVKYILKLRLVQTTTHSLAYEKKELPSSDETGSFPPPNTVIYFPFRLEKIGIGFYGTTEECCLSRREYISYKFALHLEPLLTPWKAL